MPCTCKNITPQSAACYAQQVTLRVPDHLDIRRNTPDQERATWISVDPCIVDEIRDLWDKGIVTHGCCCGHGLKGYAMICVREDFIPQMKAMGYQVWHNPSRPGDEDSFIPKSI